MQHSAAVSRPSAATGYYVALLLLAALGAGIAGYLTYTHYHLEALVCAVGNCTTVQQSEYSVVRGIPVAILGLGMYVAVAGLVAVRLSGWRGVASEYLGVASWAILLAGVLYAGYLTYVELWVIDAICQWCVASAVVTTIAFAIESLLLWRGFSIDAGGQA